MPAEKEFSRHTYRGLTKEERQHHQQMFEKLSDELLSKAGFSGMPKQAMIQALFRIYLPHTPETYLSSIYKGAKSPGFSNQLIDVLTNKEEFTYKGEKKERIVPKEEHTDLSAKILAHYFSFTNPLTQEVVENPSPHFSALREEEEPTAIKHLLKSAEKQAIEEATAEEEFPISYLNVGPGMLGIRSLLTLKGTGAKVHFVDQQNSFLGKFLDYFSQINHLDKFTFTSSKIEQAHLPENEYDVIQMENVIHFVHDSQFENVVSKLDRSLKDQGFIKTTSWDEKPITRLMESLKAKGYKNLLTVEQVYNEFNESYNIFTLKSIKRGD